MRTVILFCLSILLAGCAGQTEFISYDFTKRAGLYVLGYAADEDLRRAIEDQLIEDIRAQDMTAFASYRDVPSLSGATRESLVSSANDRKAIAILIVNQVVPGEDGLIDNPARITPDHPNLKAFFEYSKTVNQGYRPGTEVFAEVNAFLLEANGTRLVWSGTTWSFNADGKGGAISDMSANIARELGELRDALRPR